VVARPMQRGQREAAVAHDIARRLCRGRRGGGGGQVSDRGWGCRGGCCRESSSSQARGLQAQAASAGVRASLVAATLHGRSWEVGGRPSASTQVRVARVGTTPSLSPLYTSTRRPGGGGGMGGRASLEATGPQLPAGYAPCGLPYTGPVPSRQPWHTHPPHKHTRPPAPPPPLLTRVQQLSVQRQHGGEQGVDVVCKGAGGAGLPGAGGLPRGHSMQSALHVVPVHIRVHSLGGAGVKGGAGGGCEVGRTGGQPS
jgi:hypothetical protein